MSNSKNQNLQQKLRNIGYRLAEGEEYEQYLQEAYGDKYVPQRGPMERKLRASHRNMLRDLYRSQRRG